MWHLEGGIFVQVVITGHLLLLTSEKHWQETKTGQAKRLAVTEESWAFHSKECIMLLSPIYIPLFSKDSSVPHLYIIHYSESLSHLPMVTHTSK